MNYTSYSRRRMSLALAALLAAGPVSVATLAPAPAAAAEKATEQVEVTRQTFEAGKGFDSAEYLKQFKVDVKNPKVSGVTDNKANPVANAFDGNWATQWNSEEKDWDNWNQTFTKPVSITVSFDNEESVSRILYRANVPTYFGANGYPTDLAIQASTDTSGDTFTTVATVKAEDTEVSEDYVCFELSKPVAAKRIRLTFNDWYSSRSYPASAAEIKFLREDKVLDSINGMFSDANQRHLKDEYSTVAAIDAMEKTIGNHPLKSDLDQKIARARAILAGEIDDLSFPVHIIQKTGNDADRIVFFFVGDGFTKDQQGDFVEQVRLKVKKMLEMEPYRTFADRINVYAMCVESAVDGVSTDFDAKDTYFKVLKGTNNKDQLATFRDDGRAKLDALVEEMKNYYLDEGAEITQTSVFSNSTQYFGAGSGNYAIASLAAGTNMIVHEASHVFAGLGDEYWTAGTNFPNRDEVSKTPGTVKWAQFVGFRGVVADNRIASDGGSQPMLTPSASCVMKEFESGEPQYCEVCKEHVYSVLNSKLKGGDKEPYYVADPELLDKDGNKVELGKEGAAAGKDITLRTVVHNYSDKERDFRLEITSSHADGKSSGTYGSIVRLQPGELKSITCTLSADPNMRDGGVSYKVIEYVDGLNNKVIATNAAVEYSTITTSYKWSKADKSNAEAMSGVSDQTLKAVQGKAYKLSAPQMPGYTYVGMNVAGGSFEKDKSEVTVEASNVEVTYYYVKSEAQIELKLVDGQGNEVETRKQVVSYGTPFQPSASDFSARNGYEVQAPSTTVTYDGKTQPEALTYTLVKKAVPVDKTGLARVIDQAKNATTGMTTSSSKKFEEKIATALSDAEKVYAKDDATEEQVNEAEAALSKAVEDAKSLLVERADLTEAKKLLDECKGLEESKYTADSWAAFDAARDDLAKLVNKGDDAAKTDVGDAVAKLTEAKNNLKEIQPDPKPEQVNKDALSAAIEAAGEINTAGKTTSSVAKFEAERDQAVKAAKAVLDKQDASQSDVNAAVDALSKAMEAAQKLLVARADFSAASKALNEAAGKKEADYTAESWKVFADARAKLQGLVDNAADTPATDQQKVDAAVTVLTNAQAALKAPDPKPDPDPDPKPEKVDKSELLGLIKHVEGYSYNKNEYTTSGAKAFEDARTKMLADAKAVANDDKATDDQVNAARDQLDKQLSAAVDTLGQAKRASQSVVEAEAVLGLYSQFDQADFTAESWKPFADARAELTEAIKDVSDKTDAQITPLIDALEKARGELKTVEVVTKVDKDALEKSILAAETYGTSGKTVSSVKKFESHIDGALKSARAVYASVHVTQGEVNDAAKALDTAVNGGAALLVDQANPVKANELLAEYAKLNESDYTAESWKGFVAARDSLAKAAADVSDVDQPALDALMTAATKAYNGLEKPAVDPEPDPEPTPKPEWPSPEAAQNAYMEADKLKESDYTAESWAAFAQAKAALGDMLAELESDHGAYTQAELDAQVAKLAAAQDALVKAADPEPEPEPSPDPQPTPQPEQEKLEHKKPGDASKGDKKQGGLPGTGDASLIAVVASATTGISALGAGVIARLRRKRG